uniref:Uncharacterized protein n=1 Tax=Utricularia reniformis TaxID=192314 RepID=A0A1Y0B447_9LAMI|nr:hypothetical protein AEK19_MT2032 [Utricularia reniformis]ART32191.1 hypothetical protein AEK19_MT2032 [Utricularia reniformis]
MLNTRHGTQFLDKVLESILSFKLLIFPIESIKKHMLRS